MVPFRKFSGALKDTGLVREEGDSNENSSSMQSTGKLLGYLKTNHVVTIKD
jgi:hypothetical protein